MLSADVKVPTNVNTNIEKTPDAKRRPLLTIAAKWTSMWSLRAHSCKASNVLELPRASETLCCAVLNRFKLDIDLLLNFSFKIAQFWEPLRTLLRTIRCDKYGYSTNHMILESLYFTSRNNTTWILMNTGSIHVYSSTSARILPAVNHGQIRNFDILPGFFSVPSQ